MDFSKLKCLDATTLKLMAMITMLVDHIGAVLFPDIILFRIIGRLAFPIFCYFVAEAVYYTKNTKKYMFRLLFFAIISEPAYDLAFYGHFTWLPSNVMFTFLFAVVGAYVIKHVNRYIGVGVIFLTSILAELCHTDYGMFGVVMVYLYYILRDKFWHKHAITVAMQVFGTTWIQRYSAISALPLMMYNGKKGKDLKYLFYIFYPAHIYILYILSIFLSR